MKGLLTKNAFFNLALDQASRLLGRRRKLLLLIGKLTWKMRNVRWKDVREVDLKQRLAILGRLIKAYALGRYRDVPLKSLLLIVAAVLYFVMPLDLIPDIIPGLGFTDDLGILVAVYQSLSDDVDRFLEWERTQLIQL